MNFLIYCIYFNGQIMYLFWKYFHWCVSHVFTLIWQHVGMFRMHSWSPTHGNSKRTLEFYLWWTSRARETFVMEKAGLVISFSTGRSHRQWLICPHWKKKIFMKQTGVQKELTLISHPIDSMARRDSGDLIFLDPNYIKSCRCNAARKNATLKTWLCIFFKDQ